MLKAIFDDHYESFPTWREAGLSDLVCVHVDAHLDVMRSGFTEAALASIKEARSRAELEPFRGNPKLAWGGFHCGNYLYPALKDGTVAELIWVLPPAVVEGETFLDGVRQLVQDWVDLDFEDYLQLNSVEGRVEGRLEGCPFTICTSETFPKLSPSQRQRLALDIDVDYFVDLKTDRTWQTPQQLHAHLGELEPKVLTVAYSVDGGYTPLSQRYLGEVTLEVFSGDPTVWKEPVEVLKDPAQDNPEELESMLEGAPEFLKPALLFRLNRLDEAADLDENYRENPLNLAQRRILQKRLDEALTCLGECPPSPERSFTQATLAIQAGRPQLLSESIVELETSGAVTEGELPKLIEMKVAALLDLGKAREALEVIKSNRKRVPDTSVSQVQAFQALKSLGDRKKAARSIRKALKLASGRVSSLGLLVEAAKLYDEMGQTALAKATRRELKSLDVTGRYIITTMLDEAKL